MPPKNVTSPAGFVPETAISFGERDTPATPVSAQSPLPVAQWMTAAIAAPLAGSTAASAVSAAFIPDLGRPIWISLSGNWIGTVTVRRSVDGGATRLPLTVAGAPWGVFTANAQEAVGEESVAGARWYVDVALTSGSVDYRMEQ
ncbi:hypothetical protein SAMIE_1032340 [Sphingobium amiense]|uniref:DUF2793 domain-containing protein n=1 Tax=Sphingobium amiense TaxID=135719 RepID=A0A494W568_9SPHN|nr:hypothetical protein [Sphingobium amiense]BBD99733.1 hypothetical protein SAMIE_1032340 [Sphingobium amiense]